MIHSGCDSSVNHFSFAVVILVQEQQRTSPQPTSQRSCHSHHDANNHAIHATTPPSTHSPPPSSPLPTLQTPFNEHRAVTISAGRMTGAGWQQQGCGGASPAQNSRLNLPSQNSRSNISRPNLPPLVVVLSEKGEGWRVLSRLVDAWCDAAREEERPPFETCLETPRRKVEQRTGRSPALQKGAGEESPY